MIRKLLTGILLLPLMLAVANMHAQQNVVVNMAMVDGLDITPDNILNFQVHSGLDRSSNALIKGTIVYRKSNLRISYSFQYRLQPGLNIIPKDQVRPQFTYSTPALKELFEQHRKLPQGIYEYCVGVQPDYNSGEGSKEVFNECVYHKSEDIFLINLIDPEDGAEIYEYNPMLSWTVNYPFAGELTYRLRVAEVREGQNNVGALSRNNPVYDEKNIMQMSQIYPVYAKPLQKFQPYAWTVDAYYKGILLGGAAPWRFTIIEDSLMVAIPTDQSYYDFSKQGGDTKILGIDTLKLKFQSYSEKDTLQLQLQDEDGKEIKYATKFYALKAGTNYMDLDFPGKAVLKHKKTYIMFVETDRKSVYKIPFTYINPLFLKK
ncbi:hypothetical protein [Sphingobacterium sp. MYb388]|uniref:hypothetical protein n=1 Tax=Sphingobacterium sp. MYb388 TaxID=2745437 RepID=UPI0030A49788